jgi:hypothetical protein
VTDEPDLRQLGGFRTPLAAGMLSGVLAGAALLITYYIEENRLIPIPYWGVPGVFWSPWHSSVQILPNMLLCCGPAVARRNLKLAGLALLWAVAFFAFDLGLHIARISLQAPFFSWAMAWWFFTQSALAGALLGFALTRLHGYKPYSKWAPLLGAACAVFILLSWRPLVLLTAGPDAAESRDALFFPVMWEHRTRETVVLQVMWRLTASVVLVVLPTAAIEYAQHKQARNASRQLVPTGGNA